MTMELGFQFKTGSQHLEFASLILNTGFLQNHKKRLDSDILKQNGDEIIQNSDIYDEKLTSVITNKHQNVNKIYFLKFVSYGIRSHVKKGHVIPGFCKIGSFCWDIKRTC